jgi:hypothetical protein
MTPFELLNGDETTITGAILYEKDEYNKLPNDNNLFLRSDIYDLGEYSLNISYKNFIDLFIG